MTRLLFAACLATLALPLAADPPRIVAAEASRDEMGWRISVTLAHPDTGWDHYADGWEIVDAEGNRLGYRELHHPHVEEQPFTRSLRDVVLPDGVDQIFVRARCSVDGWGEARYPITLRSD